VRDGHDTAAAREAHGRLDPDDPVRVRGADDAAVGFGAETDGGEIRRDRRARAGAGAARVAIQCERVVALSAASAPPARRVKRSEVRPFAERELAEDDRAAIAQL